MKPTPQLKERTEELLSSFSVPYHVCSGYNCDYCKIHGHWIKGKEMGEDIDKLLNNTINI
jgi:hypothetical protein